MSDVRHALWVVPVADFGGVARHVLDVTRVGIPGWEVTVLCPEGPLAGRLREQGVNVIAKPFGPEAGMLTSMRTLRQIAQQLRPDLVHSHLAYADIVSAWTRLPRGTRRFTTEHGIAGDDAVYHRSNMQARLMALVHRLRMPRFDGVIAVSQATRDAMISKWRVKQTIAVIYNGVDLPPEYQLARSRLADEGPRVLTLSRLAPEKRIECVLEGFSELIRQAPGASLVIAGDGPLRNQLEQTAERLGIAGNTDFVGFVDADQAMAVADVVVQLSVWENHSYTLLDAVARGLGVVASGSGGNPEIVDTIASVDPETVASAILAAASQPPAGRVLGSISQMTGQICELYDHPGGA